MKKLIYLLLITTSAGFTQAQTGFIKENQKLTWTGSAYLSNYAPEGTLDIENASIKLNIDKITELELTINMESLSQENAQLQNHLKGKDFFHVKKFPKATFLLNTAITIENGPILLSGSMTIRGVTQTESIKGILEVTEKGIKIWFNHEIDRTKYGVNHNSPSLFKKIKENAIADNFQVKGTLLFNIEKMP